MDPFLIPEQLFLRDGGEREKVMYMSHSDKNEKNLDESL